MNDSSFSPHARARARRTAVQALYQWLITGSPVNEIITEFENERAELKKADQDYFREILLGNAEHSNEIEDLMTPFLDRGISLLDPVERAILGLAIYELRYRHDLPVKVVLNESIELAKMFGAEESHRFINGVLDRAAKSIRY